MELVGKTLKSKINGALFVVTELFEESGRQYYAILDMASGMLFYLGKDWFEKGFMQNIEIVAE